MTVGNDLAFRIAETLKQHCTHEAMPAVALEAAGLLISVDGGGASKRERVLSALDCKGEGNLARSRGVLVRTSVISNWRKPASRF